MSRMLVCLMRLMCCFGVTHIFTFFFLTRCFQPASWVWKELPTVENKVKKVFMRTLGAERKMEIGTDRTIALALVTSK